MGKFRKLSKLKDIPEGDGKVVKVEGREIGLFLIDGQVFAIDNVCPHMGGPLVEGQLEGKVISCPWHAWTFDVSTGICTFNDAINVATFEVRLRNGNVEVFLED
jgi:NAD(P)H-dependent nitrite reductase small subunit